jgi:hypothetical protein
MWRMRVAQDLQRAGVVRTMPGPTLDDLTPILPTVRALFHDVKISWLRPRPKASQAGGDGEWEIKGTLNNVQFQTRTTLDETARTRFDRDVDIWIERDSDLADAQDRFALSMATQALYERGGLLPGHDPGELCYHASHSSGAAEIFLRRNLVVRIHCTGPTGHRKLPLQKGEDLKHQIIERTGVRGFCPEVASEAAHRIDELLKQELKIR